MKSISALVFCCFALYFMSCQKELSTISYTGIDADTTGTDTTITVIDTTTIIDTAAVLTSTTNPYYNVTVGGVRYAQEVNGINGYEAGSGMGGDYDVSFGGSISLESPTLTGDQKSFTIEKGIYYGYQSATEDLFNGFFMPGTYAYSSDATKGVSIGWTDNTGKIWSTSSGAADQTGSIFKIVSIADAPSLIKHYIKVKSEFSCKLYDGNGNTLTLTNGSAVMIFGML